jgi:hypothetical protein
MDGKKRKVSASAMTANRFQAANVSTIADSISYPQGSEVTGAEAALIDTAQTGVSASTPAPTNGGSLNVSLASDTPASADIPAGATPASNVKFTALNFTAGSSAVMLKGLSVKRTGLSQDSDLTGVKLYDANMNQLGSTQTFNAENKAKFTFSHEIAAGSTSKIWVLADNKASASGRIVLGVESKDDVVSNASSVTGSFPVNGNRMVQVSGTSVGTLTIAKGPSAPSAQSVDIDDTFVRFGQVRLTAGSTEAVKVNSIGFEKGDNSTFDATDLSEVELVNDTTGKSLGKASFSGDRLTFPVSIMLDKGDSVDLSLRADIIDGAGKTVNFELVDDGAWLINADGQQYGYGVGFTPAATTGVDLGSGVLTTTKSRTATLTISAGKLVVSKSPNSPATGNIAQGANDVKLATFKFDARGEDMRANSLALTLACTGLNGTTEFCNDSSVFSLFRLVDSKGKVLAGPYDPSGSASPTVGTVSFSSQVEFPKGENEISVIANILSSAPGSATIKASFNPSSALSSLKGLTSNDTLTATPSATISGNTLTVKAGSLKADAGLTPILGNQVIGSIGAHIATVRLDASAGGEDAKVTSVTLTDTGTVDMADFSNFKLMDGTTQIGETEQSASATTVVFNIDNGFIVPKNEVKELKVVADALGMGLNETSILDVSAASAVGNDSGSTITVDVSGANVGPTQTWKTSGSLKVNLDAGNPAATNLVAGSTGVELARYKFEAIDEDVDVTELNLWAGQAATSATADTTAGADFSSVKVYAGTKLLGTTSFSSGNAKLTLDAGDFRIKKDEKVVLSIKADLAEKAVLTSSNDVWVGLGAQSGSPLAPTNGDGSDWSSTGNYVIVANGVASGAAVAATNIDSVGDGSGNVYGGNKMTLHDGLLTVKLNASSPSTSGTSTATAGTGKDLLILDLTATGDDITITDITSGFSGTCTSGSATGDLSWKDVASNGKTYFNVTNTGAGGNEFALRSTLDWTTAIQAGSPLANTATKTTPSTLEVAAGETKSIKLVGDTTGCATDKTLQQTVSSVTWKAGSNAAITDDATLDNLPVNGGSLKY